VTSIGWIPSSDSEMLHEAKKLRDDDTSARANVIRARAAEIVEKRAAELADEDDDSM
jgi:hypothetical protein